MIVAMADRQFHGLGDVGLRRHLESNDKRVLVVLLEIAASFLASKPRDSFFSVTEMVQRG